MNQLMIRYGDINERRFAKIEGILKRSELPLATRQQKYFVSCWLNHHRESVAMWNSYSDINGLALKVSTSALIDAVTQHGCLQKDDEKMETLFYGLVQYKDFLNQEDRQSFKVNNKVIGFQKDCCFEFEKEFRFLIKQNLRGYKNEDVPSLQLKLQNFQALEFELIFHPKMQEWKKENIKAVLNSLSVSNITPKNSELVLKDW